MCVCDVAKDLRFNSLDQLKQNNVISKQIKLLINLLICTENNKND